MLGNTAKIDGKPWHTGCFAKNALIMMHELRSQRDRWWMAASAVLGLACQSPAEPAGPIIEPKPAPEAANAIAAGALGGDIDGQPFSIQSARYIVDRRRGFEKVDISLSAGSVDSPCEQRKPKDSPSVWLRRKGATPLAAEQARLSPNDEAPWEVHYQVRKEHGWIGNGRASALIVIHDVGPDMKLNGELWACFADTHGSCVSGRFIADYCPIRIDKPVRGTEAMERPPPLDGGSSLKAAGDAGAKGDSAP